MLDYKIPSGLIKSIISKESERLNRGASNRYGGRTKHRGEAYRDNLVPIKPYSVLKTHDLCLEDYLKVKDFEKNYITNKEQLLWSRRRFIKSLREAKNKM